MDRDIFWDVFQDTGDPLCWLLTRTGKSEPKTNEQTQSGRALARHLPQSERFT